MSIFESEYRSRVCSRWVTICMVAGWNNKLHKYWIFILNPPESFNITTFLKTSNRIHKNVSSFVFCVRNGNTDGSDVKGLKRLYTCLNKGTSDYIDIYINSVWETKINAIALCTHIFLRKRIPRHTCMKYTIVMFFFFNTSSSENQKFVSLLVS